MSTLQSVSPSPTTVITTTNSLDPCPGVAKTSGKSTGGIVNCVQPDAVINRTKDTWTKFNPKDPANGRLGDYVKFLQGRANVVGAHGGEGSMRGVPDPSVVREMAKNGKPVVLASCQGGADSGGAGSNARHLADAARVDRARVVGCTGDVTPSVSVKELVCQGKWVDGNGRELEAAQMQKLRLSVWANQP
jgi:hypothetical protein